MENTAVGDGGAADVYRLMQLEQPDQNLIHSVASETVKDAMLEADMPPFEAEDLQQPLLPPVRAGDGDAAGSGAIHGEVDDQTEASEVIETKDAVLGENMSLFEVEGYVRDVDEDAAGSGPINVEMDTQMEDSEEAGANDAIPDADLSSLQGEPLQQLPLSPVRNGDEEVKGCEAVDIEVEVQTEVDGRLGRGGKRKRGRKAGKAPVKAKKSEEEEDVCFICFDGGNLVLCDRKFCPKAYHPACVNRDEAFFKTKGKWNCGWHQCSTCAYPRAAHFFCLTCTYSLCKGCIKESNFVCVCSDKGLCASCMGFVMLIENKDASKENVVDFDDRSSWEYLFKEYWLDIKHKVSLTSVEVINASNPWKGSAAPIHTKVSTIEQLNTKHEPTYGSDNSAGHVGKGKSSLKRPKKKLRANATDEVLPSITQDMSRDRASTLNESEEWASKELLDFVKHIKGDGSSLSVFEVQSLLMEYVTKYKLRDPNKKSQIICDVRLQNLFGKARVGHFEMLKLIESHILIKESSFQVPEDPGETGDDEITQLEPEDGTMNKTGSDKKRKNKKTSDESAQQINTTDYAAIDVHNISLIFLRRNLVEDLLDDPEKFHEKIVNSFVRIRIYGSGNKQDMYRLVQVVGTSKAAKEYKTGKKSTDVMLEILNLNKTETITIDSVSNQEFSEEECKRLRQSIKYGFISHFTRGEIQEKAKALQSVKVHDWFETEMQKLSHLRDRASEKGRRKDLRECVEKLQVLSDPDAKAQKLQVVPDVHVDSHMDPNYESEEKEDECDPKIENHLRPRDSKYSKRGRLETVSSKIPLIDGYEGSWKNSHGSWERNKKPSAWGETRSEKTQQVIRDSVWNQSRIPFSHGDQNSDRKNGAWNEGSDRLSAASVSEIPPMPQIVPVTLPTVITETEKMWHYCDPSGKVQGPFSMVQLWKWSTTGYFPADLRIWRTTDTQDNSILLNDALVGKFQKEQPQLDLHGIHAPQKATGTGTKDHDRNWMGHRQAQGNWNSTLKAASGGGAEISRKDGPGHIPTDSSRGSNTLSSQVLAPASRSSLTYSGNSYRTPIEQTRDTLPGISAYRSSSIVQPGESWNATQGHDKRLGGTTSSIQTQRNVMHARTENLSPKKWVEPTSLSSPTPATEQTSLSSPTPATEQTLMSNPILATEHTLLSSPTPATEQTLLASPTPAAERTSLARPTPAAEGHHDASCGSDRSDLPIPSPTSVVVAWSKDPVSGIKSKAPAPHVPCESMNPENNLEHKQQSSIAQTPKSSVELLNDQGSGSKTSAAQISNESLSPMDPVIQQSAVAAIQRNPQSETSSPEVPVTSLDRRNNLEQQSVTVHESPESNSCSLQTASESKIPANDLEQRSSVANARIETTPAAADEQLPSSGMTSVQEQDSSLITLHFALRPLPSAKCTLIGADHSDNCRDVNDVSNTLIGTEGDSTEKKKVDVAIVDLPNQEVGSLGNVINPSTVAPDTYLSTNTVTEDTKAGAAAGSLSETVESKDALLVNEDPENRLFNPINDLTPHLIPVDDIWDALGPDDTLPAVNLEKDEHPDALASNHGSPSLLEDDDSIWPEGHLPVQGGGSFTTDGKEPEYSLGNNNTSGSDVPSTATVFSPTQCSEMTSKATIQVESARAQSETLEPLQMPVTAISSQMNLPEDDSLPQTTTVQVSEFHSVNDPDVSHSQPIHNKETPAMSTGVTNAYLTVASITVPGFYNAARASDSNGLFVSAEEPPVTTGVRGSTAIVENVQQAFDALSREGSVSSAACGRDVLGVACNPQTSTNFHTASAIAAVPMTSSDTPHTPTKPNNSSMPSLTMAGDVPSVANPSVGEAIKHATSSETWGAPKGSPVPADKWGVSPSSDNSRRFGACGGNQPTSARSAWALPAESPRTVWNPQQGNPSAESPRTVWNPQQGNPSARWGAQQGNERGGWEQQRRDGDRPSGYSDRGRYGGQSSSGRPWNRAAGACGGSAGGGGPRTARSQTVCKFHENGYCKKGASCDFLHP